MQHENEDRSKRSRRETEHADGRTLRSCRPAVGDASLGARLRKNSPRGGVPLLVRGVVRVEGGYHVSQPTCSFEKRKRHTLAAGGAWWPVADWADSSERSHSGAASAAAAR